MSEQSEQDDREALVKAALKVLHPNATRNMPMALDYAHKIADAVLAAGFRRSPEARLDDTEWESQCKAPGEEWRDCVAPGCGNPRRKRAPAGPWVAIEKGGESNG